jgi:hypothetical protein
VAVRDDNFFPAHSELYALKKTFHSRSLSETAYSVFGRAKAAASAAAVVLCAGAGCKEGSDENFPRMIDADSRTLFVVVSTAATKPEHPTLPFASVYAVAPCVLKCCCSLLLSVLLRSDDLPLLVRVSYSRFRRLDCRGTGSLISCVQQQLGGMLMLCYVLCVCVCVCLCACASCPCLSILKHQPAVAQPCCEEKTEFGLEFLRPCALEETLPWLSEHRLCLCCAVFLLRSCLFP